MTIGSVDLVHTCGPLNAKRKRNYLTKHVSEVSNVLTLYQPTKSKSGNAKQFAAMAKASTGVSMKNGQASLAIRAKSHDSIHAQVGQHMWIPSLFEAHVQDDLGGTHHCETNACHWDRTLKQFRRCHIALSIAKSFWKHANVQLLICDGTHSRGTHFKHILLIAVTFDGNNQVVTLAFAIVDVEDAENWVWFKEMLDKDFPGYEVWMSDVDKGITSNAFSLSMSQDGEDAFSWPRCARHISDNCKETCKSGPAMNEEHKRMIVSLAKARTHEQCQVRLSAIRDVCEQWAEYLHRRRDECSTCCFLLRGISRYGKVTSNGVENVNGALVDERSYPIVQMIEGIVKCQQDKFIVRRGLANKWQQENKTLTHYCMAEDVLAGGEAQKRDVQLLESTDSKHKARVAVTTGVNGYIEVTIDVNRQLLICPCLKCEEYGFPCVHGKALLLHVGHPAWYHSRYHAETYLKSYSAPVPGLTTAGRLQVDDKMVPPEHKRQAGRPKKKRRS